MPTIDLGPYHNGLTPWSGIKILALMLEPKVEDAAQRERFEVFCLGNQFANGQKTIQHNSHLITPRLFDILQETPLRTRFYAHISDRMNAGWVAGQILTLIYQLHTAKLRGSVNKAVYFLELYLTKYPIPSQTAIPIRHPPGRQSLRESWKEFKPVAHLWAAWTLWCHYDHPHLQSDGFFAPDRVSDLLAQAESVRFFGENHLPRSRSKPTLDPQETWVPPADLSLPSTPFSPPPLTDWHREQHKHYRSPQRQYLHPHNR